MADLERLDAAELKRRAEQDAVRDADSYARATRIRRKNATAPRGLDAHADLLTGKRPRGKIGSQEGIDGLLIHSNEGGSRLVLSEEILDISLADEVAAIMTEPIKIFHIQSSTPWVEEVRAGRA